MNAFLCIEIVSLSMNTYACVHTYKKKKTKLSKNYYDTQVNEKKK